MTTSQYIIRIVFCISCFLVSSCATGTHKVALNTLEQHKDQTFKIGIVKVAGSLPYPPGIIANANRLDKKTAALEKIPINSICETLSNTYGLRVSSDLDKTVKVAEERVSTPPYGGGWFIQNPYRGNLDYKETSTTQRLLIGQRVALEDNQGNIVNIVYGFQVEGFGFRERMWYEIIVKFDGIVLAEHKDDVAVVSTPKKGLILDMEGVWNQLVLHADKVNDALVKNLNKDK